MKKYLRDYSFLFSLSGIIILLDQWTKYLIRTNIPLGDSWSPWPWLAPYARLVHWRNTGAAFGMFQEFGGVFTILAIIVSLAIIYYFPQVPRKEWSLRVALGLQLAGAVGNLIDRLTIGSVIDFISIGNFAVFNVADASISTGVAILVLGMLIHEYQQHRAAPSGDVSGEAQEDDSSGSLPEESDGRTDGRVTDWTVDDRLKDYQGE